MDKKRLIISFLFAFETYDKIDFLKQFVYIECNKPKIKIKINNQPPISGIQKYKCSEIIKVV